MTVPYESMNRKKSPCVSDCHARSLRGCKSVLLFFFFCILRAKRGCCGVIVVGKGNVASIGSVATPGRNACWGVPQTPKKRGETMANRTRKIVLRVPDAGGTGTYPAEDGSAAHTEFFCLRPEDADRWLCCPHRHHRHPGADRRTAKDWCQY